jgi:mannose-1-phosphate guanylyltransferase/MurNAc alpha-1-phosphate uridylyltransferase
MADSVAGVVLAAGAGSRLAPLSRFRPKPLCPVGDTTLLDHNLGRVGALVDAVALNAHHHADQVVAHVGDRAHVSLEPVEALGTAGGVAHLRGWLAGRAALVVNGDTWTTIALAPLLDGWDGSTIRVLVVGAPSLGAGAGIVGSLLPPDVVASLPDEPAGLYEVCWRPAMDVGRLEVLGGEGDFVACDTPADYLRANLVASDGAAVIGADAVVEGELVRSVVWPGAVVLAGERLVDAIRIDDHHTVLVR